jgi:hypothetical protein
MLDSSNPSVTSFDADTYVTPGHPIAAGGGAGCDCNC